MAKNNDTVQVRISRELRNKLKIAAIEEEKQMLDIINELVSQWLQKREHKKR